MKICLSSTADNLDGQLDPLFGRCAYLLIVDPQTLQYEAIPNASAGATGGAGIQAAQTAINKQATAVISGNIGPNAFGALQAAGIEILIETPVSIRAIIEKYNSGQIQKTATPTVASHAGTQPPKEPQP